MAALRLVVPLHSGNEIYKIFLCTSCFSSIYVINISCQSLGLSMQLILIDITAAHKAAVSGKYRKQDRSRVRERTYFEDIKCQRFIMCR